jgi:hypothetical protein
MTVNFSLRDDCFVGYARIGSPHLEEFMVRGCKNNDVFSVFLLEADKLGKPAQCEKISGVNASVG